MFIFVSDTHFFQANVIINKKGGIYGYGRKERNYRKWA